MSFIQDTIGSAQVTAVGWALLHFVWQGTVVAICLAIALRITSSTAAQLRYRLCGLAYLAMVVWPCYTLIGLWPPSTITSEIEAAPAGEVVAQRTSPDLPEATPPTPATADNSVVRPPTAVLSQPTNAADVQGPSAAPSAAAPAVHIEPTHWIGWLVAAWLSGVAVGALRLAISYSCVIGLRRYGVRPVDTGVARRLAAIARRLGVRTKVRALESTLVKVPAVIGYWRPLVLVPATALTGLSAAELDAMLAHELAHIRRGDYLVNLLQAVVETILFYHPAVWWTSRRISQEREHCCDDLATAICGDRVMYAQALVRMEEIRGTDPSLLLTARGGDLRARVKRLLTPPTPAATSFQVSWLVVALLSTAITTSLYLANPITAEEPAQVRESSVLADAIEAISVQLARSEFSAQFEETRNVNAFRPGEPAQLVSGRGEFTHRRDGARWSTEFRGFNTRSGSTQISAEQWSAGFDGKLHYSRQDEALVLAEENLTAQTLAPLELFWQVGRNRDFLLQTLRRPEAKVKGQANIDGVPVSVVEAEWGRPDSRWKARFSISQQRSWLPLQASIWHNGQMQSTQTLSDLRKTPNGWWYPGRIEVRHHGEFAVTVSKSYTTQQFRIPDRFSEGQFEPRTSPGERIIDRRSRTIVTRDPWWPQLQDWVRREFDWPAPDLRPLEKMYSPNSSMDGRTAAPLYAREWIGALRPPAWDDPQRKVTILYFFGGRSIAPHPQQASALRELLRTYGPHGLDVIGIASSQVEHEKLVRSVQELEIDFPVAVDQPSTTAFGRTFAAYHVPSYWGVFLIDHTGSVKTVVRPETESTNRGSNESALHQAILSCLRAAGIGDLPPLEVDDHNRLLAARERIKSEWHRQATAAPSTGSVRGTVTDGTRPLSDALVTLTPELHVATTGRADITIPDPARLVTVATDEQGRFRAESLVRGHYAVTFSHPSRAPVTSTVLVSDATSSVANGKLRKAAEQPKDTTEVTVNPPATAPPINYTRLSGFVPRAQLPRRQPHVVWEFTTGYYENYKGLQQMHGLGEVVVDNGSVYVGDAAGKLTAIDSATGNVRWQVTAPGTDDDQRNSRQRPGVDKGQVYFSSGSGVVCLNRESGKMVWHQALDDSPGQIGPIPAGDHVYTASYNGNAYALDRDSGRVVWRASLVDDAPDDPPGFSGERARFGEIAARPRGLALSDDLVMINIFDQSRVIALRRKTGELAWSYQTKGWVGPAPTVAGDRVYVSSQDRHLHCLELSTGKLIWKFRAASWLSSRAAVYGQHVFLPCNRGYLYCLEAKDGELVWAFRTQPADRSTLVYSFPVVTSDLVCFATGAGMVYAVGRETGQFQWKLRPEENSELFSDVATDGRRLFVTSRQRTADGTPKGQAAVFAIGQSNQPQPD